MNSLDGDPCQGLSTIVLCAIGGAVLAIPSLGYGPLIAVMLGLMISAMAIDQLLKLAI
jgi:hypothetical protein